jgi:hypothetical protein
MKLFNEKFGNTVVEATCDQVSGGYGLEVYASRYDDWTLSLMVVNKNLDSSYTASIELSGYMSDGTADVWQIVNDMPIDAPWNGTSGITYQGQISGSSQSFSHTFPKASVTCIWINPDPAGIQGNIPSTQVSLMSIPNPATDSVSFHYSLREPTSATIEIFSIAGRLIRSLSSSSSQRSGVAEWNCEDNNGTTVPPGIYLVKLTSNNLGISHMTKLILL